MSVFDQSFDEEVIRQLKIREKILSAASGDDGILTSRPKGYIQYANNKTPFIRLQSGVDITSPNLKAYFNLKKGSDLAKRFILEGGTSLTSEGEDEILTTQRSRFMGKGGKYGSPELGGTSDLGIRPMPGINSLSIKSYGENIATLRIATLSVVCYDIHQLEALEILYMRPGYSVLLEWGHSIYFDKLSQQEGTPKIIDQNIDALSLSPSNDVIYDKIETNRYNTSFNYDAMISKVRNFSWESSPDGSYRCTIELISKGDIIDSLKISVPSVSKKSGDVGDATKNNATESSNKFLGILNTIKIKINESTDLINLNLQKDINPDLKGGDFAFSTYKAGSGNGTKQAYIRLSDFIRILNISCIYREGEKQAITIKHELNYCRSHPYQISSNPHHVLVAPFNDRILKYGGEQINIDLTTHFPYRSSQPVPTTGTDEFDIKESYKNRFRGDMNEILISIDYAISTFEELIIPANNNEVYLKDYMNRILSGISMSLNGINDFRLIRQDNNYTFEVVDYNYRDAGSVAGDDRFYTIPLMGIGTTGTGGSYVRDYRLSTSLTNEISTIVSIQAQAGPNDGGIDGYNTSVFNAFNVGITDRLSPPIESSFNKGNKAGGNKKDIDKKQQKKENVETLISNIIEYLNKITKYDIELNKSESEALDSNLKDLIQYSNHVNPIQNLHFGSHAPIPLNLSITIDGVSGLKVGNIFRLPADRLPHQYRVMNPEIYGDNTFGLSKVAFIVFGIDHNVDQSGWTTILDCQMIFLKPKSLNERDVKDPVKDFNESEPDTELTNEEILGLQTATQQTQ